MQNLRKFIQSENAHFYTCQQKKTTSIYGALLDWEPLYKYQIQICNYHICAEFIKDYFLQAIILKLWIIGYKMLLTSNVLGVAFKGRSLYLNLGDSWRYKLTTFRVVYHKKFLLNLVSLKDNLRRIWKTMYRLHFPSRVTKHQFNQYNHLYPKDAPYHPNDYTTYEYLIIEKH